MGSYLVRTITFLLLVCLSVFIGLREKTVLVKLTDWDAVYILAQVDIARSVFYSILPALFLLLFIPSRTSRKTIAKARLFFVSFSIALFSIGVPWFLFHRMRPGIAIQGKWILLIGCLYFGFNVFGTLWFHYGRQPADGLLKKIWPLSDLFCPMVVWSVFRKEHGPALIPFRLIPVVFVCMAPFWVFLFAVQHSTPDQQFHFALTQLDSKPCYQVICLADNKGLVLTNNSNMIRVIDSNDGKIISMYKNPNDININTVHYDRNDNEMIFADESLGDIHFLNAEMLKIKKQIRIENPIVQERPDLETRPVRTLLDDQKTICLVFWALSLTILDTDGKVIQRTLNESEYGDIVYDEKRKEFYILVWTSGYLYSIDVGNPKNIKRACQLKKDAYGRILIDREHDRAFITAPVNGDFVVLDLASFQPIRRQPSLPGVRVIGIDANRRLMVLGGFAPVLEIRDLDTFSLIDRISGPAWVRWIDFNQNGQGFITSKLHGLFRLDLAKIDKSSFRSWLGRHDPFYALVDGLYRLMIFSKLYKSPYQ